ncbi:MAG: hypothetical protein WCK60_01645 [Candidatus Nomurabacteria bacterium]
MQDKNSFFKWTFVAFIIIVIVIAGFKYVSSRKYKIKDIKVESSFTVIGSTTPLYAGESVLDYNFTLPKTLTKVFEDGGRSIIINDSILGTEEAFVYLSNQEYKGYTEEQYFENIILPTLEAAPLVKNTIMVNDVLWYHFETNTLVWDIASFKNEKWLTIIKSNKGNESIVSEIRKYFVGQ